MMPNQNIEIGVKLMNLAVVLAYGIDENGQIPTLARNRVLQAAELYKQGEVHHLLMSGNSSFYAASSDRTEAEAMHDFALKVGVDSWALWLETDSDDTFTQAEETAKVITHIFADDLPEIIYVITSELQQQRARLAFQRKYPSDLWTRVFFIIVKDRPHLGFGEYWKRKLDERVKWLIMQYEPFYNLVKRMLTR